MFAQVSRMGGYDLSRSRRSVLLPPSITLWRNAAEGRPRTVAGVALKRSKQSRITARPAQKAVERGASARSRARTPPCARGGPALGRRDKGGEGANVLGALSRAVPTGARAGREGKGIGHESTHRGGAPSPAAVRQSCLPFGPLGCRAVHSLDCGRTKRRHKDSSGSV